MNLMIAVKAQSCKLYNNKYIIVLAQIRHTEIFAFKAVVVFQFIEP